MSVSFYKYCKWSRHVQFDDPILQKTDTEARTLGFAWHAYRLLQQIPQLFLGAALPSRFPRTRLEMRRRAPHCASRAPCRRVGAPNTGTARSLLDGRISPPLSRRHFPIDTSLAVI